MSVADEVLRLQQAKADLATSITNKGVTVPSATTLDGYAALVDQIQTGGGSLPYDAQIEWLGVRQGAFTELSDYVPTGRGISIDMVAKFISYPTSTSWAAWFTTKIGNPYYLYRVIRGDAANRLWVAMANVDDNGATLTITLSADTIYHLHLDDKYFTLTPANGSISAVSINTNHNGNANTTGFQMGDHNTSRGVELNIYSFTVRNYGTVVLDYIPVRVGTTGYMYDKVGNKLYGKAAEATADLVLGNDKT